MVVPLDLTLLALERLTALWPRHEIAPAAVRRFNADMAATFREVRDFTVAHDVLPGRQTDMPDSLRERIDLFMATGHIDAPGMGPVRLADWLALFLGMGLRPRAWHPAADLLPEDELKRRLAKVRTSIQDAVNVLPPSQNLSSLA
jgi:tryptophan halogenase